MRHANKASRALQMMRVVGHHAVTHPSNDEGGHDDDEGDDDNHDDDGDDKDQDDADGDDDASSGATPLDHGCQGVDDPLGSTPLHQSPDDTEIPELEDVLYVSLDRADQPPSLADQPHPSTAD